MLDRWRAIRHGRFDPWLPDEITNFLGSVKERFYYHDRLPEFTVNRFKQRLGANDVVMSIRPRGDVGPQAKRLYEDLEDGVNGIHEMLDPVGYVDLRGREHQVADGVMALELEFMPSWTPEGRLTSDSDEAYDRKVKQSRAEYGLPVCLSAPDPRSLYWVKARNQLKIVAKVVDVPLIDVQNKWTPDGFRLTYRQERQGKLDIEPITMGAIAPAPTAAEWGKMIRLVVLADDAYIYHCCYPNVVGGTSTTGGAFDDAPGAQPQLILLGKYPNPLGHPPFYLAGGRSTSDANPGYEYLPLPLEIIETAPHVNQVRTIQNVRGVINAMLPWHMRRSAPDGSSTTPITAPRLGMGFWDFDGQINRIPLQDMADLRNLDETLSGVYNAYNQSMMAAMQSGMIGRSTPAWSIMQLNEEQIGMLLEALSSRATAYKSVTLDVLKCLKDKHVKDGGVYIQGSKRNRNRPESGRFDAEMEITEQMLDLDYRLDVSIEAMTQSQRAANTEYHRRLWIEKRISDETYDEHIGIRDRVEEQARIDRQAIEKPMRDLAWGTAMEIAKAKLRPLYGSVVDVVLGGSLPVPALPGGEPAIEDDYDPGPRMPGQGMSIQQPNQIGRAHV